MFNGVNGAFPIRSAARMEFWRARHPERQVDPGKVRQAEVEDVIHRYFRPAPAHFTLGTLLYFTYYVLYLHSTKVESIAL